MELFLTMQNSYWENKSWFQFIDFTVVGSGIVGLHCALALRKKHPKSKILVLERGLLPSGASTKNAGFTCFGSLSEIIHDLNNHSEQEVLELVKKRIQGLKTLRSTLGDRAIDYKEYGGFELFRNKDLELFEQCREYLEKINKLIQPLFPNTPFKEQTHNFGFTNVLEKSFCTPYEGQIDTGKMMIALIKKAISKDILILNNAKVTNYLNLNNQVSIEINNSFEFKTNKLLIATNGFASEIVKENVQPARAQVLITKPIKNLKIKGNFHLDKGYNYFRNIDGRILLGGGRNLDAKREETTRFETTTQIQNHLEKLLNTVILPNQPYQIEQRWSGIMGVGNQKTPIVKQISDNVFCGIRLGGMGVAIGSIVGAELSEICSG